MAETFLPCPFCKAPDPLPPPPPYWWKSRVPQRLGIVRCRACNKRYAGRTGTDLERRRLVRAHLREVPRLVGYAALVVLIVSVVGVHLIGRPFVPEARARLRSAELYVVNAAKETEHVPSHRDTVRALLARNESEWKRLSGPDLDVTLLDVSALRPVGTGSSLQISSTGGARTMLAELAGLADRGPTLTLHSATVGKDDWKVVLRLPPPQPLASYTPYPKAIAWLEAPPVALPAVKPASLPAWGRVPFSLLQVWGALRATDETFEAMEPLFEVILADRHLERLEREIEGKENLSRVLPFLTVAFGGEDPALSSGTARFAGEKLQILGEPAQGRTTSGVAALLEAGAPATGSVMDGGFHVLVQP